MDLETFRTPGLGDASYLLASGREAVVVDPQRDAWRFLRAAEQHGWRITHVLETHVHNDYLSGALEVRSATGAEIVVPARGGYAFAHLGVDDGDAIELGALRLSALATPGHTPEHLAWAVTEAADGGALAAVFTGGSLLVGSAGRTDLLGDVAEPALTADQRRSLRRLAELPDAVRILPTHGSGSFCAVGESSQRETTTLGEELRQNMLLQAALSDATDSAFRDRILGPLGRFPAYYAHMAPINRRGPRLLDTGTLPPPLAPAAFEGAIDAGGTVVVDGRNRVAFAEAHLEGSLNVELGDAFASYVGWLVPFATPLLLVLPDPATDALQEAVGQLVRIGFDDVRGHLAGGVEAWAASGRPTRAYPTVSIRRLEPSPDATLLDVRQPTEWRAEGLLPGSIGIFVADLQQRLGEVPRDRPVTVLCTSGLRASMAASILDAAGFDVRLVARGGASSWPGRRVSP
jgi:glyoxylase-like metal-dependent hydrolase (beta-lactamase superfamily II)/rhodanese-related sulfurtransferase